MAHLIDMSNGRQNMAYVGETPWHGLGQKVNPDDSLEVWMQQAGLDWTAVKTPIMYRGNDGGIITDKDNFCVYRDDTNAMLGTCKGRYNIVQPAETVEFFRDVIATQGFKMETMGSLAQGARIWALAKTDADFRVNGTVDKVGTYLLLATSFDGSLATVARFLSTRVVCQNTLTMGLSEKVSHKVSVSHSTTFNAAKVKEELGIYTSLASKMEAEASEMAKFKMSEKDAMRFIIDILEGKDAKTDDIKTRNANIIKNVYGLFDGNGKGSTLASADGTLWGVVNAITEYQDHHINARSTNNRLSSAWFGAGEKVKNLAYKTALDLIAA